MPAFQVRFDVEAKEWRASPTLDECIPGENVCWVLQTFHDPRHKSANMVALVRATNVELALAFGKGLLIGMAEGAALAEKTEQMKQQLFAGMNLFGGRS